MFCICIVEVVYELMVGKWVGIGFFVIIILGIKFSELGVDKDNVRRVFNVGV